MPTVAGKGSKMTPAGVRVRGFAAAAVAAEAHDWYYINGQPASSDDAQVMAARGLVPSEPG